ALQNKGNALLALGRDAEASACYQRVVTLRPDDGEAHYAEGFARLRLGDLPAGFRKYEWRWQQKEARSVRRNPGKPQWDGSSPIAGRTILLHAEQGFGDTIQFARYIPLVEQRGARIILDVQPPVRQIVAPLVTQGVTLLPGERPPAFDCYCPLASLPLAFKT